MERFKFVVLALIFVATSSYGSKSESQFVIDKEHTLLSFEVDHLVISSVSGRFDEFEGVIGVDAKTGSIRKISGIVGASSINTGNAKRDKHLRSGDFFEVEKHPKIMFVAEGFDLKPGEKKTITARISIRGITKAVPFEIKFKGRATDPWGTEKIVVDATALIKRKEFGLTWNEALEAGGVMVGEEVRIQIKTEAILKTK